MKKFLAYPWESVRHIRRKDGYYADEKLHTKTQNLCQGSVTRPGRKWTVLYAGGRQNRIPASKHSVPSSLFCHMRLEGTAAFLEPMILWWKIYAVKTPWNFRVLNLNAKHDSFGRPPDSFSNFSNTADNFQGGKTFCGEWNTKKLDGDGKCAAEIAMFYKTIRKLEFTRYTAHKTSNLAICSRELTMHHDETSALSSEARERISEHPPPLPRRCGRGCVRGFDSLGCRSCLGVKLVSSTRGKKNRR